MNYRILAIALLAAAAPSCEKVKNIARKGRAAIDSQITTGAGGKVDPALEKLVDRNAEGVVFRMDLSFPESLVVKTTAIEEISGRVFEKSAIGSGGAMVKGTTTTVSIAKRSGNHVSYQLIDSVFAEPLATGQDVEKQVKRQVQQPFTAAFVKTESKWKPVSNDFHTANLAQSLSPVFDQLLVDSALTARPMWFGSKRLKVGDKVPVSDKSLAMIVTGNATGRLELLLESFDAVAGHPCAVFSFSGNFRRKGFPGFDGSLTDEERTIESGKIWLSLLYPVILKLQEDGIQTIRGGQAGGNSMQASGSSKLTITREWKRADGAGS